ncbi:MAG: sodium:proton antiporter [Planctomycetes bacterium]|nr:sodium:proton antiporter [Planctomycetota bacterium]
MGLRLPLFSVLPFAVLLLGIAVLPLFAHRWWDSHWNKGLVCTLLGVPVGLWIAGLDSHELVDRAKEYVSFIVLLATLYVISGGVHVKGAPSGTPLRNTLTLAIGAVLASLIGTTGASMLLIQPFLRANEGRARRDHLVLFFILVVANVGGSLTPLGDPPLYLGFLRGVPFFWTLGLWPAWALGVGFLLVVFHFVDSFVFEREELATKGSLLEEVSRRPKLVLEGVTNCFYLALVVAAAFLSGKYDWPFGVREGLMAGLALASLRTTPRAVREANRFSFAPILEVAVLFAGIFLTMIPALAILHDRGHMLGMTHPWQFFWGSGVLSSFLDNAPTYLTFLALAQGMGLTPEVVGIPHLFLSAISIGSVFMGANTYIGNGPNFMIKAIAEANGVRMPSFGGYVWRAGLVLLPLYVALTFLFYV